ncbi:MAG: transglutaminase-like cysteine peptidase [Proteobacteria bacterium]|nr:transglutaminase-like cysteine peptidase [Pseudomonadota bacterium]
MNIRFWILITALVPVLALTSGRPATAGSLPALFDTAETRVDNHRPFPKWTGMLERYFADAGAKPGICTSRLYNRCHAKRWAELIDQLKGRDLASQLDAVNTYMNQARYTVDSINWGVRDYWATPGQFLAKYGDCEDYAIAKFLTLKRLGVDARNMRIVILQDLNLRIPHAVLAVYTESGIAILDNQIKHTVQAKAISHYQPIISLNEDSWWLHRVKGR